MRIGSLLAVLTSVTVAACATEAALSPPPQPQTFEQAAAQRDQADALRAAAEQRYAAEQNACYAKFLVNDCLVAAKSRYTEAIVAARKLDQPAIDFEREARRRDLEAKEAQRAADLRRRQTEEADRAQRFRAEQAAKSAARDAKLAEKAQQAEEGRRKTAEEQARRQARLEKRARQDAERETRKAAKEAGQGASTPAD